MSLSLEKEQGFTLMEILAVIVIIAILLTLGFSGVSGMMSKSRMDSAKAEMDIIEQGLEAYKARFGDYPKELDSYTGTPNDAEELMFNALLGKVAPDGSAINVKPMLNYSPLNLENANLPNPGNSNSVSNTVVDPWGQAYRYQYDPEDSNWESFGYLLYSIGSDGLATASVSGEKNDSASNNEDNIYAR